MFVKFFLFSVYPLGSGSASGSGWTFFGSRIRIHIILDADPQHWSFCNTLCLLIFNGNLMSFWKILVENCWYWYKLSSLILPPLNQDPDPYEHFWDPGSGSAWKIMRIRSTGVELHSFFFFYHKHKPSRYW